MESNKYFTFRRFYLLLQHDILINYKNYLITASGVFLVLFVALYVQMPKENLQIDFGFYKYQMTFLIALVCLGTFVGLAFPDLESKIKTSNYLLLPGSVLEKFLEQFLIRVIVGSLAFCIIFWLDAHLARLFAFSVFKGQPNLHTIDSFHFSMLFQRSIFYAPYSVATKFEFILGFFSTSMYLFSIRLFFRRFSLIKSIISLLALLGLSFYLLVIITHIFYPDTVKFKLNIDSLNIYSDWFYIITYTSWIFLLFLGYFKLKEKKI